MQDRRPSRWLHRAAAAADAAADAAGRQRNRLVRIRNRALLAGRGIDFRVFHERPVVAVYPELGLVYNRIMKSGNSTLTAFLNDLRRGRSHVSLADMKEDLLRPGEMSWAQARAFPRHVAFTVVRDPYGRALSCFLHKVGAGADPAYADVPGFGERSAEGFERYLDWLAEGEAGGRPHLHEDTHWRPQRSLLYQPPEAFFRVCRLERVAADMEAVLEAAGLDPAAAARLRTPHRMEVEAGDKLTSAARRAEDFHTARSRAAVRRLYAEDFEAFGYPE